MVLTALLEQFSSIIINCLWTAGEHMSSRAVLHNLHVPGDFAVLGEPRRGGCGPCHDPLRYPGLPHFRTVEEQTQVALIYVW